MHAYRDDMEVDTESQHCCSPLFCPKMYKCIEKGEYLPTNGRVIEQFWFKFIRKLEYKQRAFTHCCRKTSNVFN